MATTSIVGASFSADEQRILFSSNASGIFNAYMLPASGDGTETPEPVTRSTIDSTFAVSFFPYDDRVLFTRDHGGDENFHLFVLDREGPEKDLTPGETLKAQFAGWRPDGSAFLFPAMSVIPDSSIFTAMMLGPTPELCYLRTARGSTWGRSAAMSAGLR